jgi:hypothetical protein
VRISWLLPATDYDMYIYKDSPSGPEAASSASTIGSTTEEVAEIDPREDGTGKFVVVVVYFAATAADQYSGSASVGAPSVASSGDAPDAKGQKPSFASYSAPARVGTDAGEPTVGVNWRTGNVMYIAGLETLRVTFNASVSPATATWTNVSAPNTSIDTLDPILFSDSDAGAARTNRTFVSQLAGKASLMSFTDDDGVTWTPSHGSGINSGVDHQTVGGGPYARNADGTLKGGAIQRPGLDGKIYPHAVYYASQDVGMAQIARSDDGGLTFGLAVPMYDLTKCGGLHGHIKVASDGTIYVPNSSCEGRQGVVVSEDNGMTWDVRTVPGSTGGSRSDPSVGIGADGTLYLAYADGDTDPKVAVSRDKGQTWAYVRDVGASQNIQAVVFPAMVAGDGNRAAMFFLGTSDPDPVHPDEMEQNNLDAIGGVRSRFGGAWYGFVSLTYDGGNSWVTVNATPADPVQRGPVCMGGFSLNGCQEGTRNLLDFNDVTVDAQGRVVAAFADGCVTAGCIQGDRNGDGKVDGYDNDLRELPDGTTSTSSYSRKATIIRQTGGKGLFATQKFRP